MLVGINWTSPYTVPVISQFSSDQTIDFCEILIDNFLNHSAEDIKTSIGNIPVAFHIMWSRFLERPMTELKEIGKKIRRLAAILKPLYISDHLAQFTYHKRRLPLLAELNYLEQYTQINTRVLLWQEILDCQIAFENFPSTLNAGHAQTDFYEKLLSDTQCKLLFDFSNAIIAEKNSGFAAARWERLIDTTDHFHAAGYRISDTSPPLLIDSHDSPVSAETISLIQNFLAGKIQQNDTKTMVVERDANFDIAAWKYDLLKIKGLLNFYGEKTC